MKIQGRFLPLEPIAFISLIAFLTLVWGFVEIADDVNEGDTHKIDTAILMLMRNPLNTELPWGPVWFQEMMRDITALGSTVFLGLCTLCVTAFFLIVKKYTKAACLMAAVVTGLVISNLLKSGFDRPRPDLVPHGTITYTASFPSSHSMMSAVVFLSLGILLAKTQTWSRLKIYFISLAVFLTFIVGVSRIYLGVHWPSDVLAGWIAGSSCALIFWFVERSLSNRAKRNDPA